MSVKSAIVRCAFVLPLAFVFSVCSCSCSQNPQDPAPPPPMPPPGLLQGATWQYSMDGGASFSPLEPTIPAETTFVILAKTEFNVDDLPDAAAIQLTHTVPLRHPMVWRLNGQEIKVPLEGMWYRTIPGIDPQLLRKGRNVLTVEVTVRNVTTRTAYAWTITLGVSASLVPIKAEDLKVQTGPIVGAFGRDFVTVTLRTNLPARVALDADPVEFKQWTLQRRPEIHLESPEGFHHRFLVKPVKGDSITYALTVSTPKATCSVPGTTIRIPRGGGKLRFVVLGDSRSNPKDWGKLSDMVLQLKPVLVVHTGDLVWYGPEDWRWDEEFAVPAKEMLASVPFLPVYGNHEPNTPLLKTLFYTPSRDGTASNWAQKVGSVLLIGIDGVQNWSQDGKNARWLEKTLAGSKAKFVFLANHYPAWTSSRHGTLTLANRPKEKTIRQGQEVVFPLLVKYGATAMLAGHDHCYERSEPPGGVSHIITGGGGASLYWKSYDAEEQNPHSKVFTSEFHYCVFDVDGDTCTMKAVTIEGQEIDTRTWTARNSKREPVTSSPSSATSNPASATGNQ